MSIKDGAVKLLDGEVVDILNWWVRHSPDQMATFDEIFCSEKLKRTDLDSDQRELYTAIMGIVKDFREKHPPCPESEVQVVFLQDGYGHVRWKQTLSADTLQPIPTYYRPRWNRSVRDFYVNFSGQDAEMTALYDLPGPFGSPETIGDELRKYKTPPIRGEWEHPPVEKKSILSAIKSINEDSPLLFGSPVDTDFLLRIRSRNVTSKPDVSLYLVDVGYKLPRLDGMDALFQVPEDNPMIRIRDAVTLATVNPLEMAKYVFIAEVDLAYISPPKKTQVWVRVVDQLDCDTDRNLMDNCSGFEAGVQQLVRDYLVYLVNEHNSKGQPND